MNDAAVAKAQLEQWRARIDSALAHSLPAADADPQPLHQAMRHAVLNGGKRIRPLLVYASGHALGAEASMLDEAALAVEFIHCYSLVHDDLPAMDDDDLRRGKPSNHKQFDEATAILAGDGLLTEAFTLAASVNLPADRVLKALHHLSVAAGPRGMVGGQMLDMKLTGQAADLERMREMHAKKTGAMIESSCVTGAILGGGDSRVQALASAYGRAVGLAFQITDDILDVVGDEAQLGKPVGSDEAQGKSTYPALLGIERSRALARESVDQAMAALSGFSHPRADFLRAVARYILDRAN